MNIGELWVANPMFPSLVIILGLWVSISTIVQSRNWFRLRELEKHNKLLQETLEKLDQNSENSRHKRCKKKRKKSLRIADRMKSEITEPVIQHHVCK